MRLTPRTPPAGNGTVPSPAVPRPPLPQRTWCAGAREDPLTGLLAFPDFHHCLPASLVSALQRGDVVALAIGDVDGLKEHVESTNSSDPTSYGHLAGNAVMTRLGAITRSWFHQQSWTAGCVATFGGDEVIIAVQENDPNHFLAAVRSLRDRLGQALPVTVSFALAMVTPRDLPADREPGWVDRFTNRLFSAVDRCLFVHKAARRAAGTCGGIVAVTRVVPTAPLGVDGLFGLPTATDEALHATATSTLVSGERVLLLPCVGPVGMRGRRVRVAPGYRSPATRVVLSVHGQAAITAPRGSPDGPIPVILSAVRDGAHLTVPVDLRSELAATALDWSVLPEPERDQMLHLVRESADATIRRARISAVLSAVAARTRTRP
jgi:GGDEF domain-containing protein